MSVFHEKASGFWIVWFCTVVFNKCSRSHDGGMIFSILAILFFQSNNGYYRWSINNADYSRAEYIVKLIHFVLCHFHYMYYIFYIIFCYWNSNCSLDYQILLPIINIYIYVHKYTSVYVFHQMDYKNKNCLYLWLFSTRNLICVCSFSLAKLRINLLWSVCVSIVWFELIKIE